MSSYDQYIKPRYIKSGPELDNVITIGGKAIPGVDGLEWTIADPLTVETQELIAEGVKFYLDGEDVTDEVHYFKADPTTDYWKLALKTKPRVEDIKYSTEMLKQHDGRYAFGSTSPVTMWEDVHGFVEIIDEEGNVLYEYDC